MSTTPAGWYPDPADDQQQRYWDGAGWTHQTRPDPQPTPTSTQPPAGDPPAGGVAPPADAEPFPDGGTHPSPDDDGSTGRRGRTAALFSVGTVALVALAASAWLWFNNSSQTLELRLEPVAVAVDDAFTTSVATTEHALPNALIVPDQTASRLPPYDPNLPPGPARLEAATPVAGSSPGLFGGTRNQQACNPDQLVAFLTADLPKAEAWAAVHGIDPADIDTFVAGLTPLVLTRDTQVTNHGFRDGSANQIPAVLQAGTAVLVDQRGLPVVKCGCGNPLLPPAQITPELDVRVVGSPWAGWHPDRVVIIGVDTRVDSFVLVDLDGGDPFLREVGTHPDQDRDLPDDQLCQHIVDHPTCTPPGPPPDPDPEREPAPDPDPEPAPELTAESVISAGSFYTCGLQADGTPVCWGYDRDGQSPPPAGLELAAISAGEAHICGLKTDGTPVCWGDDFNGQSSPPAGLNLTVISAGGYHTCALDTAGTPVCWGRNDHGQSSPPAGVTLTAVTAGRQHTCGLDADGGPVCWGWGGNGESSPPAGVTLTAVTAGRFYTCGLHADGGPVCWVSDDLGRSPPPEGRELTAISAGEAHICGLQAGGTPVCWGSDDFGQSSPPAGLVLTAISAGFGHTCGLQAEGTPICWGRDYYGQASPPDGLRLGPGPDPDP